MAMPWGQNKGTLPPVVPLPALTWPPAPEQIHLTPAPSTAYSRAVIDPAPTSGDRSCAPRRRSRA